MTPEEILRDCIQQSNATRSGVNKYGNPQWMGTCPCHDDSTASLALSMGEREPMVHCHAGCETRFVVSKFGYAMSQLFHEWSKGEKKQQKKSRSKWFREEDIEAIYSYHRKDCTLSYQVCRVDKEFPFRRPDKEKPGKWIWNAQGVKKIIYRLPDVLEADPLQSVFIVEGEKDVDRLWSFGLIATCNSGGASASLNQSKWKDSYSDSLAGRHVVIIPDNDEAGRVHADHIAKSLDGKAASVKVLTLPDLPDKGDVSDWFDAGGVATELLKLADTCDLFNVSDEPKHLVICNYTSTGDGKTPLSIHEIVERIESVTSGWPRRVGNALFVPRVEEDGIDWIESPSSLFGFLASAVPSGTPDFGRGGALIPKSETFEHLRRTVKRHEHVEFFPHEPPMAGHYYACKTPDLPASGHLMELVDLFCPKTPADRQLILSMFLTMFWGGLGGKRPAFLITGEGRGSGKSVLVYSAARLVGGTVDISPRDDADRMKARLLSPEGMRKRVVIIDNVKSLRFSLPDFEALVTAEKISGRRDFMGEQTRPNNITWTVTLNGPSLSTDITSRAVMIRLASPVFSGDWDKRTYEFITNHADCIKSNILRLLQAPSVRLSSHIRWGSWGSEVLGRCSLSDGLSVDDLQRVIIERQKEADVEADDGKLIEEKIRDKLQEQGYNTDYDRVFIPTKIIALWINEATGEKYKVAAAGRVLNQKIDEKEIKMIEQNPTNKRGKGFIWNGPMAGSNDKVKLDIESRISNEPRFM